MAVPSPSPRLRPGQILVVALWCALGSGLLEAGLVAAKGRLIQGFIYLSPHVLWMAPTGAVLWFALPALATALAARIHGSLGARNVLAGFVTLGAFSLLLLLSRLHPLAGLALALGIGIQIARILTRHWQPAWRFIRVSTPLFAGLTLLLAAGVMGWTVIRERRLTGGLGRAPAGAPNIVLIVLDTVRRADLGLYGYGLPTTPALQRWAARGTTFDHAIATSSWTLPSHAGMFTGRWPHELDAGWLHPLGARFPTVAEVLAGDGYLTAGFVANILYCNRSFGLARGFTHYEDYRVSPGELVVNSSLSRALSQSRSVRRLFGNYDILGRKNGGEVTDAFLTWSGNQHRPFFAFLNYFDAHQPYLPPAAYQRAFKVPRDRRFELLEHRPYMGKIEDAAERLSPADVEAERAAYDAALAYLDHEVDRVLSGLEQSGRLSNSIVIVTSDHGEQFMEHGLFDHGNSLYRFVTEVPLVIIAPGRVPAGLRVASPVSLRDLPRTMLGLAGLAADTFPGSSLARYFDESAPAFSGDPVISETSGPGPARRFRSIVASGMHAIWSADSVELYDFVRDPAELRDLSRTPEGAATLRRMETVLDSVSGPWTPVSR
ncbi:MAG: sulfatase [Gemmatimonadales bacterium]